MNKFPSSYEYYGESLKKKIKLLLNYLIVIKQEKYLGRLHVFHTAEKNNFYQRSFLNNLTGHVKFEPEKITISELMINDIKNWLVDDILVKVDRMTMAVALEVRSPFLDYELIEMMASLPDKYKIRNLTTKYLLKKIACKYLPKEIVYRKKHGFASPLSEWFKNELKTYLSDKLLSKNTVINNFFNPEKIQNLYLNHMNGMADESEKLWTLLILETWCRKHL